MAERIDNVVFDVGGVLTTYHQKDYFVNRGYDEELAARLRDATQMSVHWKEFDRNVLTNEEILARFCADAPELADIIPDALGDHHNIVTRREAAIPWVESVKAAGRNVYVLSNFSKMAYYSNREALDFEPLMKECYWSWQHQQIKPEVACYLDMIHTFGIDPAHTVFIDDTERNLVPAREAGLQTIHFVTQDQAEADLKALF